MPGPTTVLQARTQRPQARVLAQSDRILNYAGANYSVTGNYRQEHRGRRLEYWHKVTGSSTMLGPTTALQARTQRPQARVLAQSDRILDYTRANYSVTGKDTEAAG